MACPYKFEKNLKLKKIKKTAGFGIFLYSSFWQCIARIKQDQPYRTMYGQLSWEYSRNSDRDLTNQNKGTKRLRAFQSLKKSSQRNNKGRKERKATSTKIKPAHRHHPQQHITHTLSLSLALSSVCRIPFTFLPPSLPPTTTFHSIIQSKHPKKKKTPAFTSNNAASCSFSGDHDEFVSLI